MYYTYRLYQQRMEVCQSTCAVDNLAHNHAQEEAQELRNFTVYNAELLLHRVCTRCQTQEDRDFFPQRFVEVRAIL